MNPKFTLWNTNKAGGWEIYKDLTENNEKFNEVARDCIEDDPNQLMKVIDKELNRIKFKAFGKVKIKLKPKADKILAELQEQKIKHFEDKNSVPDYEKIKEVDSKIAAHLLTEQRIQFEKELSSLKDIKHSKGKSALIFKVKDKVVGKKKVGQEATVLMDPKTSDEVTTSAEIKQGSIDYCQDLLTTLLIE